MKRNILAILILSICLTIVGLLLDDDLKEPSTSMRFLEFFAMIGIIFILTSCFYFVFHFLKSKLKAMTS